MERLTYFENGKWRLRLGNTEFSGDWVNRIAAYEDTGLEPEEINELLLKVATLETIESIYDGLGHPDHLRELVQAEKDGRLVVLPCKVGDLEDLLEELTCARSDCVDGVENYTTGYRYGHRNGQIELLQRILRRSDGTSEEAKAALKGENNA